MEQQEWEKLSLAEKKNGSHFRYSSYKEMKVRKPYGEAEQIVF